MTLTKHLLTAYVAPNIAQVVFGPRDNFYIATTDGKSCYKGHHNFEEELESYGLVNLPSSKLRYLHDSISVMCSGTSIYNLISQLVNGQVWRLLLVVY